jgi:carboxyl-terminal processing protease
MTQRFTPTRLGMLVLMLGGLVAPAAARPVSPEARAWADDVWTAAIDGDRAGLDVLLHAPASVGVAPDARAAFLEHVRLWQAHEAEDAAYVTARMAKARAEMLTAQAEQDPLESLRLVLELQTLSQSLAAPFGDPQVQSVLADAEAAVTAWRAAGQLFYAQQGLLRLRAVYEDTGRHDAWDRLTAAYETVSDQMKLLRRYQFADFHRRYVDFHRSRGDEVKAEYSPRLDSRWKDEVRDADLRTAAASLQIAVTEHVESVGLSPLLSGGIAALRVLTSEGMLATTFPTLADDEAVAAWKAALDATEASLEVPGAHISLERTMQRIQSANADTIALPDGVLWREFTDGAMDELDRFSQVIWPYEFEQFQRQMRGKFVGVGVQIKETLLGEIQVVTPLEGKPAFYAGVKADDIIATVDGDSTAGWTVHDAVRNITGPTDTQVVLGLRRETTEGLVEVTITRGVIRMPTVNGWRKVGIDDAGRADWDWMIHPEGRIGYIRLTGFDQETKGDLLRAIGSMRRDKPLNGLVLDLRYNPGGLLDLAAFVSNLFVPRGDLVTGEDRSGRLTFRFPARSVECYLGGVPTVVLVNRGSASASEIVAGCLQAHEAAVVLGERSFGKGSVQTVHPVGSEARIKVTNQYYRLPSADGVSPGRLVHKRPGAEDWGVLPDLVVKMSVDDWDASERLRIRAAQAVSSLPVPVPDATEDQTQEPNPADIGPPDINRLITDGFDPQLELALLLLHTQILAETVDQTENTPRQMAGGPVVDLRSRAGGR